MGVADTLRNNVKADIDSLRKLGIKNLIMLSGDNQGVVDLVSAQLNLTKAYGNMLPEDKVAFC